MCVVDCWIGLRSWLEVDWIEILLAREDVCEGIAKVSGDKGIPIYRYSGYVIHIDAIDGLEIEIQLNVHLWDF